MSRMEGNNPLRTYVGSVKAGTRSHSTQKNILNKNPQMFFCTSTMKITKAYT